MDLKPSGYVVLGMLSVGARTGYEIKRLVELSARFFWTISPVQIYPELKRLEAGGLVLGRADDRGGIRRRQFELTPSGLQALREWLTSAEELTVEWRDMGLLKLFFADVLEPEEALDRVRALGERSARLGELFRSEIVPAAELAVERRGKDYSALVARFGLDFNEWVTQWCEQMEREIAHGGSAKRAPRIRRS
jgi:DNA-binding PadR family transcriptional regulator